MIYLWTHTKKKDLWTVFFSFGLMFHAVRHWQSISKKVEQVLVLVPMQDNKKRKKKRWWYFNFYKVYSFSLITFRLFVGQSLRVFVFGFVLVFVSMEIMTLCSYCTHIPFELVFRSTRTCRALYRTLEDELIHVALFNECKYSSCTMQCSHYR